MSDTIIPALAPRYVDGRAMRVVGLAERYTEATREAIPGQWTRFHQRLGEVRGRTDPCELGVCADRRDGTEGFEYMTAVAVGEEAPVPNDFVEQRLPARPYAGFSTDDGLAGLQPLIHAVFRDWLPSSGRAPAGDPLFLEVYGEDFDPATLGGPIEIWLPLADPA